MIPKCIGIILDGNRRWARKEGISTVKGHEAGSKKLKEVFSWAKDRGVEVLIVFGFSTENWNRASTTISGIVSL